jgi:hypothetical protein
MSVPFLLVRTANRAGPDPTASYLLAPQTTVLTSKQPEWGLNVSMELRGCFMMTGHPWENRFGVDMGRPQWRLMTDRLNRCGGRR